MNASRLFLICVLLLPAAAPMEGQAADGKAHQQALIRAQQIEKAYLERLAAITEKAMAGKLYELAQTTTQMGLQIDPANAFFRKKEGMIRQKRSVPLVVNKRSSPGDLPAATVVKVLKALTAERNALQQDTAARFAKLADWCVHQELPRTARELLVRAESIDDHNEDIKRALHKQYVLPYGWLDQEAHTRIKQGMIPINGAWKSKDELVAEEAQPLSWEEAREFRSAHFLIRADLPIAEILAVATLLEAHYRKFYASVGDEMALPRIRDIAICCFAKKSDYVAHAKRCTRMKDGDKRIAYNSPACKAVPFKHYAIADNQVRTVHMIFDARNEKMNQSVLQHESTHTFLRSVGRAALRTDAFDHTYISAFTIEGVATSFERDTAPYLRSCKAQAKAGKLMPLREFVVLTNPSLNRATLYSQCNGLTHFFMHADNGKYRKPFLELLYHVHARVSNARSFEEIFGRPPDAFEDEWIAYLDVLEIQ